MKRNCWQIKNCMSKEECLAYGEARLNGVHGGINGGRACWIVVGTFCSCNIKGEFASKNVSCRMCEVYQIVAKEEGDNFKVSALLLPLLD